MARAAPVIYNSGPASDWLLDVPPPRRRVWTERLLQAIRRRKKYDPIFANAAGLPALQTEGPETPDNHPVETNKPTSVKRLNGEVTRQGTIPWIDGIHCEVWMGLWGKTGGDEGSGEEIGTKADTEKVALKVLRTPKEPERAERARERLESELPNWAELRHPNILPFYGGCVLKTLTESSHGFVGIVTDIGTRLYTVFPWRENGSLLEFVKKHPREDKNRLLRGSAAGLSYLHSRGFVHGNVRCNNVLVSGEGEPQICDFGLANIIHETYGDTLSKTVPSPTIIRYIAPELIKDGSLSATIYSDTYSFATLILECITEAPPFSNIPDDASVIRARISEDQRPPRPDGLEGRTRVSDCLWELVNHCWSVKPDQRPTMERVHRFFFPNLIKHTYGTLGSIDYDPSNPDHRQRSSDKYLGITGEAQLDVFIPVLSKGTLVSDTQEFRKKIAGIGPLPQVTGPVSKVPILRYTGSLKEPCWMDNEPGEFKTICYIPANLSKASCMPGVSRLSSPNLIQEYEAILLYSPIEFNAQLAWKEDSEVEKRSDIVLLYDYEEYVQGM